ncbi:MAG: D-alanyl-D-alanine carboxypeptidase family protein [Methylocystis sp.]
MHPPEKPIFRGLAALATILPIGFAAPAGATPSVVIDVASGQILEQEDPTAVWYPASVTKLMTVYVALDAVREGRLTLDTPMVVSARAAKMAPSKMGFRPGSEVTLRNALIMLMVKSANDVAVTVAEGVSGSVEAFADEMNKASAALGMRESNWVNPNGLPDARHVTSARDLAILGRALLLRFPEFAGLYNIDGMRFGGKVTANHNGMLGRYPGADGMKTGFTCPAGYNLVASATHSGQKLIAVVLGAPSPASRTAKTASLLDRAFQTGSPMGSLESLPSNQGAAPPDLRDTVCRHRARATQEFMAEVEDVAIPITAAPTGNPVLDALAGGQQAVSVKDLALLPRQQFAPVAVYAGRAPGYQGPVARPRPAGVAIGGVAEATAYSGENGRGAEGAEASPISRPAQDAKPMRGAARKATETKRVEAPPSRKARVAHAESTKGKAKAKAAALPAKTPQKKVEAKKPKAHAAAHPVEKGKPGPKHAEKPRKGKGHAAKTSAVNGGVVG